MGFNTALIVRNDHLHEIKKCADFGERVWNAVVSDGKFHSGPGFDCLPSVHADTTQIIAVGGNRLRNIGYALGHSPDELAILKSLADGLGYRLVKKAKR